MTPNNGFAVAVAVLTLVALQPTAFAQGDSYRKVEGRDCCILDMPLERSSGLNLEYAFPAHTTAPGWEDLSSGTVSGWGRFGNWENESGADVDLQGLWDSMFLYTGGSDDDVYSLNMARLRLQWTQRFEQNYGFEASVSPGLYSSFDSFGGDDFSVPFGGRWVKPITPDFSIYAGANVYPTFDHVVDPCIGLRLANRDNVIFDLGYPESRLVLAPHRRFRFTAGARATLWPEYNMGDDARERLRYEEYRLYGALELGISPYTLLALQGGTVLQREISFEAGADDVEVDDGLFAGIGLTHIL
ncbi:MAG: hypothetical protein K8T26_10295 [Lentisphaerae bacterium]|nr:hypothetical protein [Lentisphaerota bacterium]